MTNTQQKEGSKTLKLHIGGMHCVNCEVLVERRLKQLDGIQQVKVNHRRGFAELHCAGEPDLDAVQAALAEEGYALQSRDEQRNGRPDHRNTPRDFAEIAAVFAILFGAYLALKQFDLLPQRFTVLEQMSYGFVIVIGLVASVSSCLAVTGGLLVAVAARYNDATQFRSGVEKLKPHIYFNAGRVMSYTLLGGLVGALGSTLTLSPEVNGALTIIASAVMILLGVQMLKLLPSAGRLLPRMPKFLAHRIHDLATRDAKGGAFALGASTFFLPCGFTQALQLYVLAKGSFAIGALTMLAFSLGTLPALLSLSALSSFASGAFQKHFLRFAGTAVIALGFLNIQYGLVLAEMNASSAPPVVTAQIAPARGQSTPVGERQIVEMSVIDFRYEPHLFTVKQGVPVEWRIKGQRAAGCGRFLMAPRLGIRQILSSTDTTVIAFTPKDVGEFAFNCGMGMMTPGSKFVVMPNA